MLPMAPDISNLKIAFLLQLKKIFYDLTFE
jgi:hypothetical protein